MYERAKIEIVAFAADDVISTSGGYKEPEKELNDPNVDNSGWLWSRR